MKHYIVISYDGKPLSKHMKDEIAKQIMEAGKLDELDIKTYNEQELIKISLAAVNTNEVIVMTRVENSCKQLNDLIGYPIKLDRSNEDEWFDILYRRLAGSTTDDDLRRIRVILSDVVSALNSPDLQIKVVKYGYTTEILNRINILKVQLDQCDV